MAERRPALPMPGSRIDTLSSLAAALAGGEVSLERGAERADTRARLLRLRGVGPWTASYVTMRALGDPDVFLDTDAAARRVLASLVPGSPSGADVAEQSRAWRPWRSYALMHLWAIALGKES